MQAGFARADITPPLGTRMSGWLDRDRAHGCEAVHDALYARALYVEHGGQEALIIGFDLLFFSRPEADRLKGAIGRRLDLAPARILLNTSHTHAGPKVGEWGYDPPSDPHYLAQVERATVEAAVGARASAVDATLWAGSGTSALPLNRRRKTADGTIDFAPNPDGSTCDALPVCLLKDASGGPICLLFSVSCHPSTIGGFAISADYPGAAMAQLDARLGRPASLFLQGAGGDAKAGVIGRGLERWRRAAWEDVAAAGAMVAGEVIGVLDRGLAPVEPDLRAAAVEMDWPLQPNIGRAGYQALADDPVADATTRLWALDMLCRLDRGDALPASVPIAAHGVQIGRGVRLVGLEGEPVADLGRLILGYYGAGVTFPLGYTDGAQMYLVTTPMLGEGGYEVDSYSEYRQPSGLAPGMEAKLLGALDALREQGIAN